MQESEKEINDLQDFEELGAVIAGGLEDQKGQIEDLMKRISEPIVAKITQTFRDAIEGVASDADKKILRWMLEAQQNNKNAG